MHTDSVGLHELVWDLVSDFFNALGLICVPKKYINDPAATNWKYSLKYSYTIQ